MSRYSFIKPLKKRHIFLKKISNDNINVFIMYNPHHIYNDNDYMYGYLLLLDRDMKIPYTTNIDDNITSYIDKRYKLDFIKNIHKIVSNIDSTKYNIYYINCKSKYYNTIFDNKNTELMWKDYYFINGSIPNIINHKINDFTINDNDILNNIIKLLFNI